MIRTAFDTDVLDDLDGEFPILFTYSDLVPDMAALNALKAKYPDSEVILIDRGLGDPTGEATVIDIETGAYTVDSVPAWVARKHGKPFLTGYCDRNNLLGVEAIERHGLWHWVATLDGTAHIPGFTPMRAPALIQILGEAQIGKHGDLSIVLESQWHPQAQGTGVATLRRELAGAISKAAMLSSDLHKMASALGG